MIKPDHPKIPHGRKGVLLVNLGTPSGLRWRDMRKFLKDFLSDPRVVDLNKVLWWFILNVFILNFRPHKIKKEYKKIWTKEGSPLRITTKKQAELLAKRLDMVGVDVEWALRHGGPSIEQGIKSLKDKGCESIVVLPLFPQYSSSCTGSVSDEVFRVLSSMRWQPQVQIVPRYFDDDDYIKAISGSIERELERLEWKPEQILLSYHNVPKVTLDKGDPYYCHCLKTTRLIREQLKSYDIPIETVFQSRLGRKKDWFDPALDDTLLSLPNNDVHELMIACPGFSADCLETLNEIGNEGQQSFRSKGGHEFKLVHCLNTSTSHINLIAKLVGKFL